MKKLLNYLKVLFVGLIMSGCASYNEIVPKWAEICSKPVDKTKSAWYKPCNLTAPKFDKLIK